MKQTAGYLSDRKKSLIAVIASMVIVNLVYGLTLPLLSLVLDAQGISKTVIGINIMAQACAGLVIAPIVPRFIARYGAGRVMQVATVMAAISLLALGLLPNVVAWFPLRFILGASAAMLWSASETLINELAAEQWRGRIIGIYGAAGAAGFAVGPLLLVLTGSEGLVPFITTAAFILGAGLPLLWLRQDGKDGGSDEHPRLLSIFRVVPHIMILNLVYAAAVEAVLAFLPLYGIHIGIGEARSLVLLTMLGIGGVVWHVPLGWLADMVNRERLLLVFLLLSALGFLILPQVIALPWLSTGFVFVLGGIEGMIYSMGVVLLGMRFRGVELASASVLFTGMWGAGTMIGPALVGAGMDWLGAESFPYLVAAIFLAYLPVFFLARR
jgi:MFS family permease